MFSISCQTVLSSVPLFAALFWPLMASFFGSETVFRQSLVICFYFIICDIFQNTFQSIIKIDMSFLQPIINAIVLIVLFSQPYITIPSFIISLFGFSLKFCEPLMIGIESRQLVVIIKKFGFVLSDWVHSDDDPTKTIFIKIFVLIVSTISYLLAFFAIRSALISAQTVVFTHASIALIIFQIILIIATVYAEEGIISDSSLVFLFSCLAFYMSVFEDNNTNQYSNESSRLEWLEENQISSDGKSLIYQLLTLPDVSTAYASEGLRWAKQHYGITFWAAFIIRITCVLSWIIDYDRYNDDEQSIETSDSNGSCVSTHTLIKVMATLVYTQMLSQQLPDSWPSLTTQWLQSFLRLIQSFILGIYYFYILFAINSDD